MGILCDFDRISMEVLWKFYCISKGCLWDFHWIPMGSIWNLYDISKGFLWDLKWTSMGFLWYSRRFATRPPARMVMVPGSDEVGPKLGPYDTLLGLSWAHMTQYLCSLSREKGAR